MLPLQRINKTCQLTWKNFQSGLLNEKLIFSEIYYILYCHRTNYSKACDLAPSDQSMWFSYHLSVSGSSESKHSLTESSTQSHKDSCKVLATPSEGSLGQALHLSLLRCYRHNLVPW
jgi:hypothetical protein